MIATLLIQKKKKKKKKYSALIPLLQKLMWQKEQIMGDGPSPRSGFSTVQISPGKILFLGGKVAGGTLGFTEIYILNVNTLRFDTCKAWGEVPLPDYNFFVVCKDEILYKYGGEFGGNSLYGLHTGSMRWYFINSGGKYPDYDEIQHLHGHCCLNNMLIMLGNKGNFSLYLDLIPHDFPLYQENFDPLGSDLSHWKEIDSTNFPLEERKFYAFCVVGQKIYTHGGQDVYGNTLSNTYVYDIEENTWELMEKQLQSPAELYGASMLQYKNFIYLFGGAMKTPEEDEVVCSDLYEYNLDTMAWRKCPISGSKLFPRRFHCACIHQTYLDLLGGNKEAIVVDVIDLERMTAIDITTSGRNPYVRDHALPVKKDNLWFIFGGQCENNNFPFQTVDVLELDKWHWTIKKLKGIIPEPSFCPSLCLYGHHVIMYGGTTASGQCDHLSILDLEKFIWESEIGVVLLPMEGHEAFIIWNRMYIIESGFEISYLEIDSSDRLGLFRKVNTYGVAYATRRPMVEVVNHTAYVYGGLGPSNKPVKTFSAIDIEVDCFGELQEQLQLLPSFSSLNKHIKVVALIAEDLAARYDGQICDPYLSVIDPDNPHHKQASNPCKASLSPTFDHELFFHDIPSRKSTIVTIEIRDLKDGYLFGVVLFSLPASLRQANRKMFERWYPLTDGNGTKTSDIEGKLLLRVIGF
eukprot:TRINITY_DN9865_c0_g1_i2.p1 TRINITY_DN9865_c0_g1~~TRINITY_DN9865_c0_g1_i2.p1  ORF type:complete len:691 (-),score=124.88 TRINITY_DN9865_c0_g1_i2:158-2230(-)